jgi:hypothetical protein
MAVKIFSAAVAMILVLAFLVPVIVKMKEIDLAAVLLVGIVMMLIDLWQSLQSKED